MNEHPPFDLRCEYIENPLGIGTAVPRFSWKLAHVQRDQRQTAYQIITASSPELGEGRPDLIWDSGRVYGSQSVSVEYGGAPLASRQRVYWRVRWWDGDEYSSPWSAVAWFETALLRPEDWSAVWLGWPAGWPGRALYVRKPFAIAKSAARARLYISGLGYFEALINGRCVGDAVLDPAYTDTSKRVMYRTFDVADVLVPGENVLAVILGSGWHGHCCLLAQLELLFADGTSDRVATDPSGRWWGSTGPIVEQSIYGGEVYDAREMKHGFDLPGSSVTEAGAWSRLVRVPEPGGVLTAQVMEPIRRMAEIPPRSISAPKPGVWVVDLGQNIAGWARLRVRGARGTRVTLRFAEMLYPDGTVNQENLRAAQATDVYILAGEGEEVWEPRFTYHGFRYVQVEGYPGNVTAESVTGILVRSAVADAGRFACSNDLLNRIQTMVRWTEQDNLHGIPTDCPQRDERMGWLNDMTARAEEALFNFDMARLFAKWIGDIYDAQDHVSGGIPGTAPWSWSPRPADPVCLSYLETSWLLYAHYGDRRLLETYYAGFKQWLSCLQGMADDCIVSYSLWGDWAPPEEALIEGTARNRLAPGDLMSTGFYYYTARLMARIAGILGKDGDRAHYEALTTRIAQAFNRHFWDEQAGGYGTNSQSCNAFALWLGLVPPERRPRVLHNLVHDVMNLHEGHLTTGNVGTKYLLEALSANGRSDVATALATQTTYPSWGYMLANDATTLWERWELYTGSGMNSHNHPMMGSVGSWFYKALAGINIMTDTVAFDHFAICPRVVGGLDWVAAEHQTVRGVIRSAWRRQGTSVVFSIAIPVNATADVTLPVAAEHDSIMEGDVTLWERATSRQSRPNIAFVAETTQSVTFRLGSGQYELVVA